MMALGAAVMPYVSNDDLPPSIRLHLPPHAQDIFRAAFNSAWDCYRFEESGRLEEIAHRVAWAAVKRHYQKLNGEWVLRESPD
jgi:cation transport regulator